MAIRGFKGGVIVQCGYLLLYPRYEWMSCLIKRVYLNYRRMAYITYPYMRNRYSSAVFRCIYFIHRDSSREPRELWLLKPEVSSKCASLPALSSMAARRQPRSSTTITCQPTAASACRRPNCATHFRTSSNASSSLKSGRHCSSCEE